MNVLAIETSSRVGSVALAMDGGPAASGGLGEGGRLLEEAIEAPREQTQRILGVIRGLLEQADIRLAGLDALVFGRGPGSFTGLRVAAAVAQGIALSTGVPIVAVSSLAALAERARREHGVARALVCVDARMGEVYWAEFHVAGGLPAAAAPERIGAPDAVIAPAEPFSGVGDGFAAHAEALAGVRAAASGLYPELAPSARDLLALAAPEVAAGRFIAPEAALPAYLRDATAWSR